MIRAGALFCLYLVSSVSAFSQSHLVLPFFNLTRDETLNWVGDSAAEWIGDSLAAQGLIVSQRAERDEIFRRLGLKRRAHLTRASVIKAGLALDASVVIYGEYQGSAQELQFTARVLNLKSLTSMADLSASGPLNVLATTQTTLAWEALRVLASKQLPSEADYRARQIGIRTEALESFAKGLEARTEEARIQIFTHASRQDPRYTPPIFELGKLYYRRKLWQESALWLTKLDGAAVRFRESMFYLGLARYHLGDYDAAAQAFRMVSEAVPLSEVFNNLGAAQNRKNDPAAVESFRKAIEGDEAEPAYHFNLAYVLMLRGEYAAAAKEFRAVLERTPDDVESTQLLGRCLRPSGPPAVGLERLKADYQESAYLQLKAILAPAKP